ncbi:T9SS type A sorting domain-containing protein [Flavobacterium tibetense]|jgi:hypothetical protein|uniref:Secretion system C-terminal sorting domain-containing protein n=1 Tax=Flavobacterium tibetense TaxID=2233533 RepID=A0A365P1W0_9FLAO|nr:T9SS type A sorting domain-containing protein [Flavobacterium tibetense]RBA28451.1 hypothetical protein DPN68_07005 [Flavobacterium tibetense]
MKLNFLTLLLISFSIFSNAQCNTSCISGSLNIPLGATATFTSNQIAQCSNCYDWDINNDPLSSDNQTVGTIKIVGSDMGQSVQIQGVIVGPFTLNLTYFDENGCHTCCFNGYVVNGPVPLPKENCFGFDPVYPSDINSEGTLNYGYIGGPYGTPISSAGLDFTWYFKFKNGDLLTFFTQNPTFRELCPDNPVKSFALKVSNGSQTKYYRSIQSGYPIPGISGSNTPTCFLHPDCEMGMGDIFKNMKNEIKLYPNPTSKSINFNGDNLNNPKISIYDSTGKELISENKKNNNINLEKLSPGIYFYEITDEDGFKQNGKIIKE